MTTGTCYQTEHGYFQFSCNALQLTMGNVVPAVGVFVIRENIELPAGFCHRLKSIPGLAVTPGFGAYCWNIAIMPKGKDGKNMLAAADQLTALLKELEA